MTPPENGSEGLNLIQDETRDKAKKKGEPFRIPLHTVQQSGFCLAGAIGLEPTPPAKATRNEELIKMME